MNYVISFIAIISKLKFISGERKQISVAWRMQGMIDGEELKREIPKE